MPFLKKNTAVTIRVGPFVDNGDGFTPETTLGLVQADVRVSKAGGAFAQKNDATAPAHDENGWYSVVLNTTDTNTVGRVVVAIYKTGALPVWKEFVIVEENAYDIMTLNNNTSVLKLKGLSLVSDDGTIPLDVDSGATCGGTAMRIRAQRANQIALQLVGPGGTGAIIDMSVASGAADAVRVAAGASGGSALKLSAPGSGSSRALEMSSAGDATLRVAAAGGYPAVKIIGSGTTEPAIHISAGKNGVLVDGQSESCIKLNTPFGKAMQIISTGSDAIEIHSSTGVGIAVRGETKAIELNAVASGSIALDMASASVGIKVRATDAVDLGGTANALILNGGTGYGAFVRGAGGYAGIDIGVTGGLNVATPGVKITGKGPASGTSELGAVTIGERDAFDGLIGVSVFGGKKTDAVTLEGGNSSTTSAAGAGVSIFGGVNSTDPTKHGNGIVMFQNGAIPAIHIYPDTGDTVLDIPDLGVLRDLGDGISLAGMLTAIAGKTANATSFDRTTDSNEAIADLMPGSGLSQQDVRDAMKLAPSAGAPVANSVDEKLDTIETGIGGVALESTVVAVGGLVSTVDGVVDAIKLKTDNLPADPAAESSITALDAAIPGYVETALTTAIAEPSPGAFPSTNSVKGTMSWLWAILRNKGTHSKASGFKMFHGSSGVALGKKATTDDGTTYTENGMIAP